MTKFIANLEVETDITLPPDIPFLCYNHSASAYTVFLRNAHEVRHDLTFLTMQVIFDAPSIQDAKAISKKLAKEFVDYLSLVSNIKVRLRALLHLFNWEPGNRADREAFYFTRSQRHDGAPYDALDQSLLDTIALLQSHPTAPRVQRAIKWFASGVASRSPDDQFTFFWLVVELIAQVIKEPASIPDKCPKCRAPLYCPDCEATPLHRPYPKQAIEQLFLKYCAEEPEEFYRRANDARNMLMHGEEVEAIEAALSMPFSDLVDQLGRLAWISILNQFAPTLVGRSVQLMQTNMYVYMNLTGSAHIQVGFIPNFDNPDPSHFPDIKLTIDNSPRPNPTLPTGDRA